MGRPFPGMDPYLERSWRDIHAVLVTYSRDRLNESLPADLIARTEERVAIESEEELLKQIYPNLRVFEQAGTSPQTTRASSGALSVAEPVLLRAQIEPHTERYVTIIDASTQRLVTVIEFLSPTNKRPGEGMRDYIAKRKQLLDGGVNIVKIDLVRQGDWIGLLLPYVAHPKHHSAYRVTSWRATTPGKVARFPISLRQRLPVIPIPLRASDQDVTLDLQSLLEQAYRNGRYERTIDYTKPCDPPLEPPDEAWARELVQR